MFQMLIGAPCDLLDTRAGCLCLGCMEYCSAGAGPGLKFHGSKKFLVNDLHGEI